MRIVAGVCFAALALVACGKAADKPATAPNATSPAPAPAPLMVDARPHLKAGLWQITMAGAPMQASSCIDDASQKADAALGQDMDQTACAKRSWSRIPGGVAFEFDCTTDGSRMVSKGTVTGDFNSAYRMESEVSGSRDGQSFSHKQVMEAKYLGACPAGMKPGDKQITVNGRTMVVPGATAPG